MMAFVLGRRFEPSEATTPWTAAFDGNGNTFWYNEVTNETSCSPPGEQCRGRCLSTQQPTAGAATIATPVHHSMTPPGGFMSPSDGCMTPADGYMTPPVQGYAVSPSTNGCPHGCTSPPVGGYESHPGSACMSPLGYRDYRQQEEQHSHYAVEARSPRFVGHHVPGAPPQQCDSVHHRQGGCRDAAVTSSSASTTVAVYGGYRWEECYRQSDGKKFWRHRETGVILKKDPYR